MKKIIAAAGCFLLFFTSGFAQQYSEAMEDNSYFIEEAINQENRVVQHISNGYYLTKIKDFIFTFTQEWPVGSQTHQLSYTLPYQSLHAGSNGVGDIMINYRYQLFGVNDAYWVAPRLSVIVPSGDKDNGLGDGVAGVQVNIPVSKRLSNEIYMHGNAGATMMMGMEGIDASGAAMKKNLTSFFIGGSGIYLVNENLNFMLELLYNYSAGFGAAGEVAYASEVIVNPGLRFAINIGDLQIVPGFAVPISFQSSTADVGLFGYLSFEHPF